MVGNVKWFWVSFLDSGNGHFDVYIIICNYLFEYANVIGGDFTYCSL